MNLSPSTSPSMSTSRPEPWHFQFEADFVDALRCIPMGVRLKLDTCGVKLKLTHWHAFPEAQRHRLVTQPCETPAETDRYRILLQQLVLNHCHSEVKLLDIDNNPPWLNTSIPSAVTDKAAAVGLAISPDQWINLTPLQRFSLIKLSRPSHENRNFEPAMHEFGLT